MFFIGGDMDTVRDVKKAIESLKEKPVLSGIRPPRVKFTISCTYKDQGNTKGLESFTVLDQTSGYYLPYDSAEFRENLNTPYSVRHPNE